MGAAQAIMTLLAPGVIDPSVGAPGRVALSAITKVIGCAVLVPAELVASSENT